jgi:hypothetical protein
MYLRVVVERSQMTRERTEHFRGSSREDEESGADEDIVRSMRNLPILQTLPGSQGEMHIPYTIYIPYTITRIEIESYVNLPFVKLFQAIEDF